MNIEVKNFFITANLLQIWEEYICSTLTGLRQF